MLIIIFQSTQNEDSNTDDKLGFIMFECGLEGITLKIVKKSQFENPSGERTTDSVPIDVAKSLDNLEASDKSIQNTPRLLQAKHDGSRTPRISDRENKSEENVLRQEENDKGELSLNAKDNGNVSSCVIEIKMVWFNFAAPPRAPITRKIDYTRYVSFLDSVTKKYERKNFCNVERWLYTSAISGDVIRTNLFKCLC